MFAVGIGGIVYEARFHWNDVSPALLVLFLMLCGFPLVINLDSVLRAALPLAVAPTKPAPSPAAPSPPDPDPVKP
jgi:hypothetical protein